MTASCGGIIYNLTGTVADETMPAWSQDGMSIAFMSDRDGNMEIYVIDVDSNLRRLTHNHAFDGFPRWSPDGQQIAFISNQGGNYEIYLRTCLNIKD